MLKNLVMVRRGNNIQRIPADRVNEYMKRGFDLVNAGGEVVQQSIPTDLNVLKTAYAAHTAKIAQLEKSGAGDSAEVIAELENTVKELQAENAELKIELAQLKADNEIPAIVEDEIDYEDDDIEIVPPAPLPEKKTPARRGRAAKK